MLVDLEPLTRFFVGFPDFQRCMSGERCLTIEFALILASVWTGRFSFKLIIRPFINKKW